MDFLLLRGFVGKIPKPDGNWQTVFSSSSVLTEALIKSDQYKMPKSIGRLSKMYNMCHSSLTVWEQNTMAKLPTTKMFPKAYKIKTV